MSTNLRIDFLPGGTGDPGSKKIFTEGPPPITTDVDTSGIAALAVASPLYAGTAGPHRADTAKIRAHAGRVDQVHTVAQRIGRAVHDVLGDAWPGSRVAGLGDQVRHVAQRAGPLPAPPRR